MKSRLGIDAIRHWSQARQATGARGLTSLPGAAGLLLLVGLPFLTAGCAGDEELSDFAVVVDTPGAALMAVHGTSDKDVWMVGANDGRGPLVLHLTREGFERQPVRGTADLWWVHALAKDDVYLAGSESTILHYDGNTFTRQSTPGLGRHTVFGLWGSSPDDLYAVGSEAGRNGFIWHSDGVTWSHVPLPEDVPQDAFHDTPALLKVSGSSAEDVWVVGDRGVVLHGNARDGFELVDVAGADPRWFTVAAGAGQVVLVGGQGSTPAAMRGTGAALTPVEAPGAGLLQGADVTPTGQHWFSGADGKVYRGTAHSTHAVELGVPFAAESLHAIWEDPQGGVWTVGGNVISGGLDAGIALHLGKPVDTYFEEPLSAQPIGACPAERIDPFPNASMARRWNEQLLNAVRRDLPRPTVHARNLFHHAIALWDIWAAFDRTATGVIVEESWSPSDAPAFRDEALAYASYRVLRSRYEHAIGGELSVKCFVAFMDALGYDASQTSTQGDSAAAFGNRVAQAVLDHFADDGANEQDDYRDPTGYRPDNLLLVVDEPGTLTDMPFLWQQLVLAKAETQNGIPQEAGVREPVGTHWGGVTPFALVRSTPEQPYFAPEHPPKQLDDEMRAAITTLLVKSSELDHTDGVRIDISPGAYGNNPLGSDSGTGHPLNPLTGQAYAKNLVQRGDFTRILAEYWADGPASETPPGHWNAIANQVADTATLRRQLFGQGDPLDALAWDVHVYLALNGALHDAAIAAWELKRIHESARPITLVRYHAALGQSSDPGGPSYHPDGLPLIDDVVEVITAESSAKGQRHEHLARYQGELALRSWRGEPGDREQEVGGVAWIRAIEWLPYQRRNFVTPAFPGYVSGHSTFSRAGAEVLAALTGSDFFPGGLGRKLFEPGYLVFEYGPTEPVELQWGTYFDAADQAGQSRLWGGIHITPDDFDGRRIGSTVGRQAVDLARQYFDGSIN